MTCIATAPVSRRRTTAPPRHRAAAASSPGVASRPVLFTKDDNSVSVACTYDYMGRRATKVVTENGVITTSHRFLYRGYLQIACCDRKRAAHPCLWLITWDPTQDVATRPLAIQKDGTWYTYGWDLTKNIWEAYTTTGYISPAYTYTAYGQVTASGSITQPIQWSSEYHDTELGLVYYNYRYYNPVDGRWVGRDFLGEQASYNIYAYMFNTSMHNADYLGLWKIIRNPQDATAKAVAERGDTWKDLAEIVGLLVSEANAWVGDYTRHPKCGRTYTIPNVIIAYWVGDCGKIGRWWVDWNYNNTQMKKAGYYVINIIANVNTNYIELLKQASSNKTLFGTYYWGHGVYGYDNDQAEALKERGGCDSDFEKFEFSYNMNFAFVFACDSIRGKEKIKSLYYRGFKGTLVPWNPWRSIYEEPANYIKQLERLQYSFDISNKQH